MTEKFKAVSITRFKVGLRIQGISDRHVKMEIENYKVWIDACKKSDLLGLEHLQAICEQKISSASLDEVSVKRFTFYLEACEHYLIRLIRSYLSQ